MIYMSRCSQTHYALSSCPDQTSLFMAAPGEGCSDIARHKKRPRRARPFEIPLAVTATNGIRSFAE